MSMNRNLVGWVAGCFATLPMTAAMELFHRGLPWYEQYPLPPREVSMNLAHKVGLIHKMDEGERTALTLASHFAYGAAMGAIYAPLARRSAAPGALKGIGFGLAVWTGSYLGLLPASGLLNSASRHPARRNALMIAAHVIWGATAGALTERLERN